MKSLFGKYPSDFSHAQPDAGDLPDRALGQAVSCQNHDRFQSQLDLGHQRLRAVERDNLDLRRQLDETTAHLHQAVAQLQHLEKRFASALAARTRQRGDLPSNAHAEHQVIARDCQTFIEHRLYALARAATPLTQQPISQRQAALWLLGELARALFEELPTAQRVQEVLALDDADRHTLASRTEQVLGEAQSLWRRAEETGLLFRWDFELLPGAPLDPARQTAWPSCDPGLPAQHVIVPGYVVEREVYGRQQVLTGPSVPG